MTYSLRLAQPGDLDTVGAITAAAYLDGGHIRAEASYLADLRGSCISTASSCRRSRR